MVEPSTVNRVVVGSSPTPRACNKILSLMGVFLLYNPAGRKQISLLLLGLEARSYMRV